MNKSHYKLLQSVRSKLNRAFQNGKAQPHSAKNGRERLDAIGYAFTTLQFLAVELAYDLKIQHDPTESNWQSALRALDAADAIEDREWKATLDPEDHERLGKLLCTFREDLIRERGLLWSAFARHGHGSVDDGVTRAIDAVDTVRSLLDDAYYRDDPNRKYPGTPYYGRDDSAEGRRP